jgi:outer membrane protein assembly factor BamB
VTSNNDDAPTPVAQGNRLLVSGLMLELGATQPTASVLWPQNRAASKRILSNTSTPLLRGDCVFSAKSTGALVCLEAATGKQLWETHAVTETTTGASIHLTKAGDFVFLFTDQGDLILANLNRAGYQEIDRTHLLDPTIPYFGRKVVWAPPAYANRHVFVRNDQELVCASLAAKH